MSLLNRELSQDDFQAFASLAKTMAGIELGESKRHLVISRLIRRVRDLELNDLHDYREYLNNNLLAEKTNFINAITTNLTYFFREDHHFKTLCDWAAEWPRMDLDIWSAGCSTGQEPYTIAMAMDQLAARKRVQITATDIDTQVLAKAKQGVYRDKDIEDLDEATRKKYFLCGSGPNSGHVKIKDTIRNQVSFGELNLLGEWENRTYDVIFCRNVFIYFDQFTQRYLLERFAGCLRPGGLLFLGHSELLQPPKHLFSLMGKTTYRRCHS